MTGADLLPEFDHEFAVSRRVLERIPEDDLDWKPHEKSFTVKELAAHIANIPKWAQVAVEMDLFDMDEPYERIEPETKEGILAEFDANVADARGVIAGASAERLAEIWSLKHGGEVTLRMPKGAVLRSFIFNHAVHHRGQLSVYLRLLDIPVPAIYGPSADER